MRKNVASQVVAFQAVSTTDGSPVTAGTPTVYYTIDGGTQGTGGGTAAHEGNGCWSYIPLQAETNGNHIAFTFALSGAVSQTVQVYTVSFDPHDTVRLGITALPNAAADAAGGLPISDLGGLDLDQMNTNVSEILTDTGTTIPASLTTITNYVDLIDDGTSGLAKIATDVAAILVDTDTTIPGLIGIMDANVDLILEDTGTTLPATLSGIQGATFDTATDSLEAIRNRGDAAWITAVGFSTLTQADIRTAVGLAAANLDTQLNTINTNTINGWTAVETDTQDIQVQLGDIKGATFDTATDSLESLRNRGDSAWITAVGFSTHSAADVWTSVTRTLTANTNLNDPTAAAIADQVWDEVLSGHLTGGSTGAALNAAGAAGDPWTTSLPGAYGAGTAGYIIGTYIDAALSTINTTVNNIETDTAEIGAAGAGLTAINSIVWGSGTRVLTANTNLNDPTAAAIADAVWDELTVGHTTASTFGAQAKTLLDTVASNVSTLLTDWTDGGRLDVILDSRASQSSVDLVDANVDLVLLDTNELQTDWANGGRLDLILDARASQSSVDTMQGNVTDILADTNELQTDWFDGGRLDLILDARASQSSVNTLQSNVTDILADTNELQTDWVNGGRLDLILDATATASALSSVASNVTLILGDTAELQTDWTNGGRLDLILDACATTTTLNDVSSRLPAALVGGRMASDIGSIAGETTGVAPWGEATKAICYGTTTTGSTTTIIAINTATPAITADDVWIGLVLKFTQQTATAALRGQGSPIADVDFAAQTITLTDALTTPPGNGEKWVIN